MFPFDDVIMKQNVAPNTVRFCVEIFSEYKVLHTDLFPIREWDSILKQCLFIIYIIRQNQIWYRIVRCACISSMWYARAMMQSMDRLPHVALLILFPKSQILYSNFLRFKVKKNFLLNIFSQNFKSRLRMRRWPLFPFGSKMADKNSLADADLIGRIMPGMDSLLSALFAGESLSRASFLPSNNEESCALAGSSGFSPSHRSFSLHDHVLSDGLLGFSPVPLTTERVVLSTPKLLASCKSVQFYNTTVSLLPSELKLVQNCGSVSVSGRGVSRRAKSESPTRRPGSSIANIAAGKSSTGTGYKIPKVSKVAQPTTAQTTPDDVKGFSSDDDSAANDSDSDEDHPDNTSSSSSRDSDDSSCRLADKKKKLKRKISRDKELLDGSHSMFDPSGDKRSKLSKVQDTYVRKMFTKLIKAEDIEDSFTALGMEKSSSSLLQVKNLDPDLLDILPGASFVAKADKSFTSPSLLRGESCMQLRLHLSSWENFKLRVKGIPTQLMSINS